MKKSPLTLSVFSFLIGILLTACSINPSSIDTAGHTKDSGVQVPPEEILLSYRQEMKTITQVNPNQIWLQRIGVNDNSSLTESYQETEQIPFLSAGSSSRNKAAIARTAAPLPKFVNNATLPSFPKVGSQGLLNSCVPFSTTYYQFSHEIGLKFGFNNTSGPNSSGNRVFSPKWTYNFINNGKNGPSWVWDSYKIMMTLGCALWDDFPYTGNDYPPQNYLAWNIDERVQLKALKYRVKSYGTIPVTDSLSEIKGYLANGHTLTFNTYIGSWVTSQVQNNPSSTLDTAYLNRNGVLYQRSDYITAHSLVITGYNDDIWLDINKDGLMQQAELGGFFAVNSWGEGWENAGSIIISYDSIRQISTAGAPTDRTALFTFNEVYFIEVDQFNPRYLARLHMSQARRDQLITKTGFTKGASSGTYNTFLDSFGGPYSFTGGNTAVDGVFLLDMTYSITNSPDVLFASVEDGYLNFPTTVKAFQFIDNSTCITNNSPDCPKTFDNSTVKFSISLQSLNTIPVSPKDLVISNVTAFSFLLCWKPSSAGITGYKIYISQSSIKPLTPLYITAADVTCQSVQNLLPNTLYTVWIEAYNNAGSSIPQVLQVKTLPTSVNSSSAPIQSSSYASTSSSSSRSSSSVYSITGAIKIQTINHGNYPLSNTLFPKFFIENTSLSVISLSSIKIRYYYTINGERPQSLWCDYAGYYPSGDTINTLSVSGTFHPLSPVKPGADYYTEISFSADAGILNPGETLNLQTRIAKSDWSLYDESDDYSYNPSTSMVPWTKVTATLNGIPAWGTAP